MRKKIIGILFMTIPCLALLWVTLPVFSLKELLIYALVFGLIFMFFKGLDILMFN